MIEINLLPPQYRAVERTPLPVFLGLILAICLIAGAVVFMVVKVKKTQVLKTDLAQVKLELEAAKKAEKEYDKLIAKITEAEKRIKTVLGIAKSKIPWALKIEQLLEIMPRSVWIENLSLVSDGKGGGTMSFGANARGTSLQRITEFKQILRSDTNFFYHFERILTPMVQTIPPGDEFAEPLILSFQVTLPLRSVK
ncbi:PilN domain-containing protein [Planctomycetota bacterium]